MLLSSVEFISCSNRFKIKKERMAFFNFIDADSPQRALRNVLGKNTLSLFINNILSVLAI